MQIAVRDTTPDDIEAICRIRQDPLVVPHQYRTSSMGTVDDWRKRLTGQGNTGLFTFRSSTIVGGDSVIGHVTRWHAESNGVLIVQCGWNLSPAYWGRGVMCLALTELFDRFFNDEGIAHVFADCFHDNSRCIRVMYKLGFVPSEIAWRHRIMIAFSNRCLRWIKRFRLDAKDWRATTTSSRSVSI